MKTKDDIRYIYHGNELNLPEFRFVKGGIYYGDKIEELKEKYTLLEKLLIKTEELPKFNFNEIVLSELTKEIIQKVEGGNN